MVGLDLSSPQSPMIGGNDLLRLTILPDLRDRKCLRTKRLCDRLSGADQIKKRDYNPDNKPADYSSCLLQRIGEHGETALHMALEWGNFQLAEVLTNMALGGKAALVVSMDDYHRTPWSIALSHLRFDPHREINTMTEETLREELRKRRVDIKRLTSDDKKKTEKLMRTEMKLVGSIAVYRQLCGKVGDVGNSSVPALDFEGCLAQLDSGMLHAVALPPTMPSPPPLQQEQEQQGQGQGQSGGAQRKDHETMQHETVLQCFTKHAQLQRADKYTVFDTPLAKGLIKHFWRQHAKRSIKIEAALYALLVLCFSLAAVVTQSACNAAHDANTTMLTEQQTDELTAHCLTNIVTSACTVLLVLRLLWREGRQLIHAPREYFRSFWNYYQLGSYLLALASTVIF